MTNRSGFEKTSGAAMSAQSNDELRPVKLDREHIMARLLGGEISARKAAVLMQEADQ